MTDLHWFNVTSDNSKHIVPVQRYLFDKFIGQRPFYIDLGKNDIKKWGKEVAGYLPTNEYIIFGLDDYLPHAPIDWQQFYYAFDRMVEHDLERMELGRDAVKHKGQKVFDKWQMYGKDTPYSVSCQFSIWKTEALKRELLRSSDPWNFEVDGRAKAGCVKGGVLTYNESSAVSKRKPNRINLAEMSIELMQELVDMGLVNQSKIVYSW